MSVHLNRKELKLLTKLDEKYPVGIERVRVKCQIRAIIRSRSSHLVVKLAKSLKFGAVPT